MADKKESQNKKAERYFNKSDDGLKYWCQIPGCDRFVLASNTYNCVSHLKHRHTRIYLTKITCEVSDTSIAMKRLKFIQNCAQLVAGDGRSFNTLKDEGVLGLVEDQLNEFKQAHCPVDMNANFPELKLYIHNAAQKIKEIIEMELKDQALALMTDIASKNGRSIISIDAQYMCNGEIILRCLGMLEMKKHSHTARNIKDTIWECLTKYGIKSKQIFSLTTDNASNMISLVELCNEDDVEGNEGVTEVDCNAGTMELEDVNVRMQTEISDSLIRSLLSSYDEDTVEPIDEELIDILNDDHVFDEVLDLLGISLPVATGNIKRVPCSAHSLQLAVNDALKEETIKVIIDLCRAVAKALRKPNNINELYANNIRVKMVRLDVNTRWNSVHRMVRKSCFG